MIRDLFTGNLFPLQGKQGAKKSRQGIAITVIFYFFLFILFWGSFGIIDETERGVRVTLGKVDQEIVQPGPYTKLPFITSMVVYDVKVIKEDTKMETYTKDIQTAKLQISVSYQLDKTDLYKVYSQYGKTWEEKIIWNNLSQQVKDVIGKYNAENLIENRDKVAQDILIIMNEKIKELPAELTQFQILNIDYNDEFERAVERKVVQSQRALEEIHKTKQIEEEAKQKIISAKAESEAMRIKAQALSQNKALVDYEAVLRWDGKLPQYVGGNSMPILNLK
jgi:regulator of protease activity HflC (stomatin/prohibitin superfamily)